MTFGPFTLQNSYFEFKIDQEKATQTVNEEYQKIAQEFSEISSRKKTVLETYKVEDAENVIVLMGSAAGTTKDAVDKLRAEGKKVGLVKINLFSPFPHAEMAKILAKIKNIAVLDRSQSIGTFPPLYTEIINSLFNAPCSMLHVESYVYGLGGRDLFAKDIEKVFNDLAEGKISKEIKYIQ